MVDFRQLDKQDNKEITLSNEDFSKMIDYSTFSTENIIIDEDIKSIIEQSFLYLVGHPKDAEELAFGESTWQVKLFPNIAKIATVTAILSGLLYSSGVVQLAGLAGMVLPAVLPLLIDIETIKLSVKDNYILTEMHRHKRLIYEEFEPKEIYNKLDAEIKEQISFSEFLDILEVLNLTGHVDAYQDGKTFKLNETKEFKLQIL